MKKVVLLGDSEVGKTSLVRRYVIDVFDDKYIATIGTKVLKKEVEYKLPGRSIHLTMMIWDILGQRDYRKMRTVSMKGAQGAFLVADLTRPETIVGLAEYWYPEMQEAAGNISAIVIGNKSDIVADNSNAVDILSSVSSEISSPYFICSAKSGENVNSAFKSIGELILGDELDASQEISGEASSSISGAIDYIISDFCEQYDDIPKGMEVVEKIFSKVGVDLTDPDKESVLKALELLADIEKDHSGREIAEINKIRRWKILEESEKAS